MQAEVRAVLTPEQRAIFDRNVAEMNAQMDAHRPMAPR
jgi:Spy/CpxP family protein refolding chaperone